MKHKESQQLPNEQLQLYRIPEVAKILSISISAVRREIQSGRLKAYRIGRSVSVPMSAIRAFLQDLEV